MHENVVVGVDQFTLIKPNGLDDVSWSAISSNHDRLRRSLQSQDRQQTIGVCKELTESIARVVLATRGTPAADNTGYSEVLSAAHSVLEYQPGPSLTPDTSALAIASAAKKMAIRMRDLRNDYGTGHGRAVTPAIPDELLELAVDGTLVWARWALRRLEHLLAGQLTPLINDLTQFVAHSGPHWADRLTAADIPRLDEADQRHLGVAVGQRAASGTFVVLQEGIEAPLDDPNDEAWPVPYREGTVEGSFLSPLGQVRVYDPAIRHVARMAESIPGSAGLFQEVRAKLAAASWSSEFTQHWRSAVTAMRVSAGELTDPAACRQWQGIIDDFETAGNRLYQE